jgi:hypothetical protein
VYSVTRLSGRLGIEDETTEDCKSVWFAAGVRGPKSPISGSSWTEGGCGGTIHCPHQSALDFQRTLDLDRESGFDICWGFSRDDIPAGTAEFLTSPFETFSAGSTLSLGLGRTLLRAWTGNPKPGMGLLSSWRYEGAYEDTTDGSTLGGNPYA